MQEEKSAVSIEVHSNTKNIDLPNKMDDDEEDSHLTLDQQEQRDEMTALDNILNDCTAEATSEAGGGQKKRVFSHSVVAESGGLTGGRMDAHLAQVEQVRQEQDGRCRGALGISSSFPLYFLGRCRRLVLGGEAGRERVSRAI